MATIISLKKIISPQPVGGPEKEKKSGSLGMWPVCPLVKTALLRTISVNLLSVL